jgi:pentatricopeptide repeat protein
MKSMARRGRWRNVLEMLMRMSAENLEMNAILCNIAISI